MPGDRSGRVHRQPPRRAARRRRRRGPRVLPLQLARLVRLARRGRRRRRAASTSGSATSATPRFVEAAIDGRRGRVPPRRADRDPVLYAAPSRSSTRTCGARSTCSRRRGARRRGASSTRRPARSTARPTTLPITEAHPLKAQSPYAATKVAADQLALAFHAQLGVPVVVLRPFNTYGPRQSARAVLPTMLRQLLAGSDEIRLGRLDPRRDLTFVADTVDGFVRAAAADARPGETIQLGTGHDESIGELVRDGAMRVARDNRRGRARARRVRPDASEVWCSLTDPTRARELPRLGPRTSLEDGLVGTAEWMRRPRRRHRRGALPPLYGTRIPLAVPQLGRATRDATSTSASRRTSCRRSGRSSAASSASSPRRSAAPHAVACASGTAAHPPGLSRRSASDRRRGLRLRPDVRRVGEPGRVLRAARPVLVDSERATWNLDPAVVVDELRRRARTGSAAARRDRGRPPPRPPGALWTSWSSRSPIASACRSSRTRPRRSARAWIGGGRSRAGTSAPSGAIGCFSFNGNKLITTRRRRDARHRRRGARARGPSPVDAGAPARAATTPTTRSATTTD